MAENIIVAINRGIEESELTNRQLAEMLGKPESTLSRELNPFDTGAKLGAMDLLPIMLHTNSAHALEYLASRMGYRLEKVETVEPDKDTVEAELLDNRKFYLEWDNIILSAKNGEITLEEAETRLARAEMDIARELQEDRVALRRELTS